jgi:DNA-binding transcriptional LysR family regulator
VAGVDHHRLASLDLNLLVLLDALLEQRSVGRAGRVVGMSQPAASRGLALLREHLGDPLLVRVGHEMLPTSRAQALLVPLRQLLNGVVALLEPEGGFDPATSKRTFVLAATDYAERVLLLPALPTLRAEAPGVSFVVRPAVLEQVTRAETGDLDLGLAPMRHDAPGLRRRRLWQDRYVLAFRRGHPLVERSLTLAEYVAWPQVLVSPDGRGTTEIDDALEAHGLARTIAYRTPSLASALAVVEHTDLVANVPALALMTSSCCATAALPFECPPLDVHAIRHERTATDPGLAWLVARLMSVARTLRK